MVIRENLVLDHFYISLKENEFNEVADLLSFASHNFQDHIKTDNDCWHGLYLYSKAQNYFEILRERRADSLGICMKALAPLTQDARLILTEMPNLDWKTFDRFIEGQKWFTAISLGDYLSHTTYFNTWISHYYQRSSGKVHKIKPNNVVGFRKLTVLANKSFVEDIIKNTRWFYTPPIIHKNHISIELTNSDASKFEIVIEISSSVNRFEFKDLEMEVQETLIDDKSKKVSRNFEITFNHNKCVLKRNTPS